MRMFLKIIISSVMIGVIEDRASAAGFSPLPIQPLSIFSTTKGERRFHPPIKPNKKTPYIYSCGRCINQAI
jgi:hypothetical protein